MILVEDTARVKELFAGMEESLIWSCLDQTMGNIYWESEEKPKSAMALLGDFCFFAGEAWEALIRFKPKDCKQDFIIMVPPDEKWAYLIEKYYGAKAKKVVRYAIKKEAHIWNPEHLKKVVAALPQEYVLQRIDREVYQYAKDNRWAGDWVSQYRDYADYEAKGMGMVVLKDNIPVSGASSYSRYRGGIEIEVDTREDCRRKGLAYICAAALILECEKCGLYPNWDAQNLCSLSLAKKLGYHFDREYTAYEIWGY